MKKQILVICSFGVILSETSAAENTRSRTSCAQTVIRLIEPLKIVDGRTLIFASEDFDFLRTATLRMFTLDVAVPSFLPRAGSKATRPALALSHSLTNVAQDFDIRMRQSALTGELRVEFNVKKAQAFRKHLAREILSASGLSGEVELIVDRGDWNLARAVLDIRATIDTCTAKN